MLAIDDSALRSTGVRRGLGPHGSQIWFAPRVELLGHAGLSEWLLTLLRTTQMSTRLENR